MRQFFNSKIIIKWDEENCLSHSQDIFFQIISIRSWLFMGVKVVWQRWLTKTKWFIACQSALFIFSFSISIRFSILRKQETNWLVTAYKYSFMIQDYLCKIAILVWTYSRNVYPKKKYFALNCFSRWMVKLNRYNVVRICLTSRCSEIFSFPFFLKFFPHFSSNFLDFS